MEVGLEDASSQFGRCIVATDQGHLRIFDLEKKTNECSLLVPHPFQSGQSSSFESYHSDSDVYVAHMRLVLLVLMFQLLHTSITVSIICDIFPVSLR